jgi:3',5'-cyclic AMP phosphodiesterase CpdA
MSVDKNEKPAKQSIERRDFIKQAAIGAAAMAMGMVAMGCSSGIGGGNPSTNSGQPVSFAVLSDIHILDAGALGDSGPAFAAYVAGDRKMLAQGEETLDVALADIVSHRPSFVLISGDLTKDGEQVDHLVVAGKLATLLSAGIAVYVIPGNHDINNPDAVSYLSAGTTGTPVPSITPTQFQTIYGPYGYNNALYKDPNSLSYIAEPAPGLWLFAIDSAEYANNIANGSPTTGGQISQATLTWILGYLAKAKTLGKVVIGMEHHPIMEHFQGMEQFFPDYILTGYQQVGQTLAAAGLNLLFTGHFHANDVARTTYADGSILTDCSTGSTVTAPCPYRFVTANLATRTFNITTSTVASIPDYPTTALWQSYENQFSMGGMTDLAAGMLEAAPYNVDPTDAMALAPLFATAMVAFYAGNPNFASAPAAIQQGTQALMASTNPEYAELGDAIMAIWKPGATLNDNNLAVTVA